MLAQADIQFTKKMPTKFFGGKKKYSFPKIGIFLVRITLVLAIEEYLIPVQHSLIHLIFKTRVMK